MEYRYNKERDRIETKAWNPSYFKAIYKDLNSGEFRGLMLYARSSIARNKETIAEKYRVSNEALVKIEFVSEKSYQDWLCGESELIVDGVKIPAKFVTKYLIAEDWPSPHPDNTSGRYGDLSKYKSLLKEKDANLILNLKESYEKTQAEQDIVRVEEDIEMIK